MYYIDRDGFANKVKSLAQLEKALQVYPELIIFDELVEYEGAWYSPDGYALRNTFFKEDE